MRINVAEIKEEVGNHKRFPVTIAVQPVELGGQVNQFDRPFTGEVEIWNTGDRLLVRGEVSGDAQVACSRCLAQFSLPLDVSFEEEFVEGQPAETEEEELEVERQVSYYSGDEIDLSESLRDHIVLELPMNPLCRNACAGLCSGCGVNLNEGACTCTAETVVDPRFAALKQLLQKPDSKS